MGTQTILSPLFLTSDSESVNDGGSFRSSEGGQVGDEGLPGRRVGLKRLINPFIKPESFTSVL